MSQKDHLKKMIWESHRRLQKREEQQARHGINTDPAILVEIEDLKAQIAEYEEEIKHLPEEDDAAFAGLTTSSPSQQASTTRIINTGGGAYIEGKVDTGGGEFVGRDKVVTYNYGSSAADLATLFEAIQQQIKDRPEDPNVDKEEISDEVKRIGQEAAKGDEANPYRVERWLGNLADMAPDILEVTVASLTNPAAGVATVIRKIAEKAREEAG